MQPALRTAISGLAIGLMMVSTGSQAAWAGSVATPECQRDLLVTNSRIDQAHRTVVSLADGSQKALCPAWKSYADQARAAAGTYKRCLTGTDQRVKVADMNAAAADFDEAYKSRCP